MTVINIYHLYINFISLYASLKALHSVIDQCLKSTQNRYRLICKCKISELLEDNIIEKAGWSGYGDFLFLDTTTKTQSMKEITDKLGFIKIKKLLSDKDNVNSMSRQATHWGKIYAKRTSFKGLLFQRYEEFMKLNNKKTNSLIKKKNGPKTLTHHQIRYSEST